MFRKLLAFVLELAFHGCASVVWAIALAVQFVLFTWWSFQWIYTPIAARPGAHDGLGLIFVGIVAFGCGMVATAVVASMEAAIIKHFLPGWEPPELGE